MDRGAWRATTQRVAKRWTCLEQVSTMSSLSHSQSSYVFQSFCEYIMAKDVLNLKIRLRKFSFIYLFF